MWRSTFQLSWFHRIPCKEWDRLCLSRTRHGDKDNPPDKQGGIKDEKKQAKEKLEIKAAPGIDKGFQISIKGEDLRYDFTDQSILEALKGFLSPSINAVLK